MFSIFEAAAEIQLFIHTPEVYVGGVISGVVILNVVKDSVDGNAVVITFLGNEDTEADYTKSSPDSDGKSSTSHHTARQSVPIIAIDHTLSLSTNGYFAKGVYQYPFTFEVPPDLPPSMSAKMPGSSGGKCAINYSLYAKLERAGGFFRHKMEETKSFIVLPTLTPSDIQRTPVVVGPLSQNATFCCCFDRGKVDLGFAIPSNWFAPNEQFQFSFVIQNDSHARVERVLIEFYQKITWSARKYSRHELQNIQTPVAGVRGSDFPPVRKQHPQLPVSMNQLRQVLVNGTYKGSMTIPNFVCASYRGQLITISHELVLTVVTPEGTSNPSIECPVTIAWKTTANNPAIQEPDTVVNPLNQRNIFKADVPRAYPIEMQSPVYGETEEVHIAEVIYETAPSAPPAGLFRGYQEWIVTFQSSSNQVLDARNCPIDVAESLNAFQFSEIFSSIRSPSNYVLIAEIIASKRSAISCEQILAAISVSPSSVKCDMIRKFAVNCIDKQNYSIIKPGLSELEYQECCAILSS